MQNTDIRETQSRDIVIIGGGPAGLSAAVAAYDNGARDILIIERASETGGILNQCIHNGFGLTRFKENMTGPEYAERFKSEVEKRGIEILTETMVIDLTSEKVLTVSNSSGISDIKAKAVILAMGCRERPRGAINVPGFRGAGVLSAGTAQKYVNIMGKRIGRDVVILGSGDIGLIMARRMTLEGAKVRAVVEIMPHSSGLRRNIAQCLDDFGIPLYLSHTVTYIHGKNRVEGVTVSKVDSSLAPIAGSEIYFPCDTVLFSVGLIPENELSERSGLIMSPLTKGAIADERRETEISGIFAAGNVLQVHDLVDFVSEEAEIAGAAAADYVKHGARQKDYVSVLTGDNISYAVPQRIDRNAKEPVKIFFRPKIVARGAVTSITDGKNVLASKKRIAVAPGEMETLSIKPGSLKDGIKSITVSLENTEVKP